jgi:hypothetical protein
MSLVRRRCLFLDECINHIQSTQLEFLDMQDGMGLHRGIVAKLMTLTSLRHLNIGNIEIHGDTWDALDMSTFKHLTYLAIDGYGSSSRMFTRFLFANSFLGGQATLDGR